MRSFQSLAANAVLFLFYYLLTSSFSFSTAHAEGDRILGNISYSNQWKTDLNKSYLYIVIAQQTLSTHGLDVGLYNSSYQGDPLWMPSLQYISRLFHLGAETGNTWSSFAIDGHYSLGFGTRQANLYNTYTDSAVSGERASLALVSLRVGPSLSYERFEYFKPYFSVTAAPFAFRQSAALSGAETQGGGWTINTAVGVQINPPFISGISAIVEYRHSKPITDNNHLLSEGSDLDLGVGYVF